MSDRPHTSHADMPSTSKACTIARVTSDSHSTETSPSTRRTPLLWLALLFLLALLVRMGRLAWQPLWWDEGYSVYFATETLGRMLWLTAHDIHPPLYYALLHGWTALFGSTSPVVLRTLSVLLGAATVPSLFWLGRTLFPQRQRIAWIGALLLLIAPMHLFYSQEVRMYALALLLGVLATTAFVRMLAKPGAIAPLVLYWLWGVLLLHSLYYGALLLLAHALSLLYVLWRRQGRSPLPWAHAAIAWAGMLVAYLPWLLYAAPKLILYIEQKVASDQDTTLQPVAYLTRHLNAFLAGHVIDASGILTWASLLGALGVFMLVVMLIMTTRKERMSSVERSTEEPAHSVALLLFWMATPIVCAWLVSLRSPFLPDGGERLLLLVLPFFLLLIAWSGDRALAAYGALGGAPLALVTIVAIAGMGIFYTTDRYTQEDYRPLLADIVQNGRDNDTLVAIFPWQVGYWRAYAPAGLAGPTPILLDDFAVEWSDTVAATLEGLLARGTLWFPEPLALGSSLPFEMEGWLAQHAANVENRWYSLTTRLTAWMSPIADTPMSSITMADTSPLRVAEVQSSPVAADNTPLLLRLQWDAAQIGDGQFGATLRLVDDAGHVWASRDYTPIGAFASDMNDATVTEEVGLPVRAGTPPGAYRVQVGLLDQGKAVAFPTQGNEYTPFAELGTVTVRLPDTPPAVSRLALNTTVANAPNVDGLRVIGAALPTEALLAGDNTEFMLFVRAEADELDDLALALTLQGAGGSASGKASIPLDYPVSQWTQGYTTALPVSISLPGSLSSGAYTLWAQWQGSSATPVGESINVGEVAVVQRRASFTPTTPATLLDAPSQFGTHAILRGYTLTSDANGLQLSLDWEVLQPILPAQSIFVHLDDDSRAAPTIAQQDGAPMTVDGTAPTGSWQPGEYLTTRHFLSISAQEIPTGALLRVGLFNPQTGTRLPVSINGQTVGDAVEIAPVAPQ